MDWISSPLTSLAADAFKNAVWFSPRPKLVLPDKILKVLVKMNVACQTERIVQIPHSLKAEPFYALAMTPLIQSMILFYGVLDGQMPRRGYMNRRIERPRMATALQQTFLQHILLHFPFQVCHLHRYVAGKVHQLCYCGIHTLSVACATARAW